MVQVLYGVNQRLRVEDVDSPLVVVRPVKTVLLVVVTGDRGLCGGYNNFVIKKVRGFFHHECDMLLFNAVLAEAVAGTGGVHVWWDVLQTESRFKELAETGVAVQLVCIGKKGFTYFKRRPQYKIAGKPPGCESHAVLAFWDLSVCRGNSK